MHPRKLSSKKVLAPRGQFLVGEFPASDKSRANAKASSATSGRGALEEQVSGIIGCQGEVAREGAVFDSCRSGSPSTHARRKGGNKGRATTGSSNQVLLYLWFVCA
jgi:hypothetical protein